MMMFGSGDRKLDSRFRGNDTRRERDQKSVETAGVSTYKAGLAARGNIQ
jgi:hypothetical protein